MIPKIWQDSTGYDPSVPKKLKEIDAKIANIRKAVENGMPDEGWAYSRMRELIEERESLSHQVVVGGDAPQIDGKTVMAYRAQAETILSKGTHAEKKRLLRSCVDKMTIAPETLEVEINYRIPEAIGATSGSPCRA